MTLLKRFYRWMTEDWPTNFLMCLTITLFAMSLYVEWMRILLSLKANQ